MCPPLREFLPHFLVTSRFVVDMDADEFLDRYAAGQRDFRECNLVGVDLTGQTMEGVDLRRAVLMHAKLDRANLAGANLRETNLQHASMDRATLTDVNLIGASLASASLRGVQL